jgi:hypothetical protein
MGITNGFRLQGGMNNFVSYRSKGRLYGLMGIDQLTV